MIKMAKKLKRVLAVFLAVCMLLGFGVFAVAANNPDGSDNGASGYPGTDEDLPTGDITIAMVYQQSAVAGDGKSAFALYRVGDWVRTGEEEFSFQLRQEYAGSGVKLAEDISKTGSMTDAWRLGLWARRNNIEPVAVSVIDAKGQVSF